MNTVSVLHLHAECLFLSSLPFLASAPSPFFLPLLLVIYRQKSRLLMEMSYCIVVAARLYKPICKLGVSCKGNRPNSLIKPLSADCHQLRRLSGVFYQSRWPGESVISAVSPSTGGTGFLTGVSDFQNAEVSEANYVILDFFSRKTKSQAANMDLPQTCIYSGIRGWEDI